MSYTKKEIIRDLVNYTCQKDRSLLTYTEAEKIVNTLIDLITQELVDHNDIKINNFVSIKVIKRKAGQYPDLITGEMQYYKERYFLKLVTSKYLKKALNKNKYQ